MFNVSSFQNRLYYIGVIYLYVLWCTFTSTGLPQNNKVYLPSLSLLFLLLFCLSFFVLRTYDLMAIYRRSRWSPGCRESPLRAPVNYPDAVIRHCAAGGGSFEILTIAEGRSVSRGAHGLSLTRGIRLIALTQVPCRNNDGVVGITTTTTTRRRRVSDGSRRCWIISRRHRDIIRKLETWLRGWRHPSLSLIAHNSPDICVSIFHEKSIDNGKFIETFY